LSKLVSTSGRRRLLATLAEVGLGSVVTTTPWLPTSTLVPRMQMLDPLQQNWPPDGYRPAVSHRKRFTRQCGLKLQTILANHPDIAGYQVSGATIARCRPAQAADGYFPGNASAHDRRRDA